MDVLVTTLLLALGLGALYAFASSFFRGNFESAPKRLGVAFNARTK